MGPAEKVTILRPADAGDTSRPTPIHRSDFLKIPSHLGPPYDNNVHARNSLRRTRGWLQPTHYVPFARASWRSPNTEVNGETNWTVYV